MIRLILTIICVVVVEFYAFQAYKSVFKGSFWNILYWTISVLVWGNLIYQMITFDRSKGFTSTVYIAFALFVLICVPKILTSFIMLIEDIVRLCAGIYYKSVGENNFHIPSRRKFVGQLALSVFALQFGSVLHGIFRGKYNFKVLKYTLYFEDLPNAFDGYRLTQISDIHAGSFDNINKVEYAVDLINEQASDAIMFTGDMVNNKADEMGPYIDIFKKLNAKDGLYSVLGNHDYGDYITWDLDKNKNETLRLKNLENLKSLQKEIGFDLLLNETRFIEKNGQRIAIIGLENWGSGGFRNDADLKKAVEVVDKDDFKILLNHDPSRWDNEIVNHDYHYHLTLSGHTHGMQFGIEIPGWFKWSPVKWRYKQWAGIYQSLGQYLNVNRGFGYLAFPGRVGIWPEITVIELKRGSKEA